jgi:Ca-activated chloride channel homolog
MRVWIPRLLFLLVVVLAVVASGVLVSCRRSGGEAGDVTTLKAAPAPGKMSVYRKAPQRDTDAAQRVVLAPPPPTAFTYKSEPEGVGGQTRVLAMSPTSADGELRLRKRPPPNGGSFPDMFFQHFGVNPTIETSEESTSTFSVATDTAAYTLTRSYLERSVLPDMAAVRVEDFVNAFDYGYPTGEADFSLDLDGFPSPNRKGYHVVRVGLKARTPGPEARKPAHVVMTIDVSGSMAIESRLQLVKRALRQLVDQLRADDVVSIVTYGDNAQLALPPTTLAQKDRILGVVDSLGPQGSTNAQAGLELAFRVATDFARPGRSTRVILCSDGVANNGVTSADGIYGRIRDWSGKGITLSTVGFGMGNYNDVLMERLAQVGHGQYAYVDRLDAARRFFIENATGMLHTIAEDVKVQVEFEKDAVQRYRLLGYEARRLENEDFENDRVDSGWIGAGHAVTALYEVKLRSGADRVGTVRLRYKKPGTSRSVLLESALWRSRIAGSFEKAAGSTQLAFVAAELAEKLRRSYWARTLSYESLHELWTRMPRDVRERPEVAELDGLIHRAGSLDRRTDPFEAISPVATMSFDTLPRVGR